jgi:predicted SAM-dependent methyltransferase
MKFEDIINNDKIFLYCGTMPKQRRDYTNIPFIGLSLHRGNETHIQHNIIKPIPLKDNTVDIVQSEDVMEHIEYSMLKKTIDEIFRVLKPGGLFRLSMPDYNCDILYNRSEKDGNGNIIFDNGGGGRYDRTNKKVIEGGHVWFPVFNSVKSLLESTNFLNDKINYLHYYDENNKPIINKIDYSKGYISRTPDHDNRVKNPFRPMSIVVDCYK